MSTEKPRQIAARVLNRYAEGAGWLENLLDAELAAPGLLPADRGLIRELTLGVVRWMATLDWIIARRTDGRTQKHALRNLLRLGLYQLFWLDRIPDHAAVNESVQLARELGFGPQSGFINALLRGCLRERDALRQQLNDLKQLQPHLGYSHPEWLCARWEKRWGPATLRALLNWNNTPPPVFARVNTLKTSPNVLAARFQTEGVLFELRDFPWIQPGLIFELKQHPPLTTLPSFQEGLFYVQDPSTLLSVRELDPHPGDAVLDTCAAPGGKTTLIAQLMANQGRILAREVDASRHRLIAENCTRLGVTCVEIAGPEASPCPGAGPAGSFDRILVDAPCSNSGVMRRRVELRWRIQEAELGRLSRTQVELLRRAAPQLKPGGTLVYSTCSLEPEENGAVVREFLAQQPGFLLEAEKELSPVADAVDGAYVARLNRISPE